MNQQICIERKIFDNLDEQDSVGIQPMNCMNGLARSAMRFLP